jgi:hypothetical protein
VDAQSLRYGHVRRRLLAADQLLETLGQQEEAPHIDPEELILSVQEMVKDGAAELARARAILADAERVGAPGGRHDGHA